MRAFPLTGQVQLMHWEYFKFVLQRAVACSCKQNALTTKRIDDYVDPNARKLHRADDTMMVNRVLFFLMPEHLLLRLRIDESTG